MKQLVVDTNALVSFLIRIGNKEVLGLEKIEIPPIISQAEFMRIEH